MPHIHGRNGNTCLQCSHLSGSLLTDLEPALMEYSCLQMCRHSFHSNQKQQPQPKVCSRLHAKLPG